jgi:hypothetical protein
VSVANPILQPGMSPDDHLTPRIDAKPICAKTRNEAENFIDCEFSVIGRT